MQRWVLPPVVFVLAYVLACALVARGADRYPGSRLEPGSVERWKHAYFAQHKDEFEVVFVGSSRAYRELNPTGFDEALAQEGVRLRSFNFAHPGMGFYELRYTVERILEQEPQGLRWILVEVLEPDPFVHPDNLLSRRNIHWHRWSVARDAARAALAGEASQGDRFSIALGHAASFLRRASNSGTIADWLRDLDSDPVTPDVVRRLGFRSLDREARESPAMSQRRRRFVRSAGQLPEYQRRFTRSLDEPEQSAAWGIALDELLRSIEGTPVRLGLCVLPPRWSAENGLEQAARARSLPLFAYHDPRAHPDLHRLEHLFNFGHLNRAGADLLTQRLARDFAPFVR